MSGLSLSSVGFVGSLGSGVVVPATDPFPPTHFLRLPSGGYASGTVVGGLPVGQNWEFQLDTYLSTAQAGGQGYAFCVYNAGAQLLALIYGYTSGRWQLWRFNSASGSTGILFPAMTADAWHRLKAVCTTDVVQLYVDGTAVGSPTAFNIEPIMAGMEINLGRMDAAGANPLAFDCHLLQITAEGVLGQRCLLETTGTDATANHNNLTLGGAAAFV